MKGTARKTRKKPLLPTSCRRRTMVAASGIDSTFPAATGIRLIGKKLCCQDRASFIYVTDGADVKIAVTIPETRILVIGTAPW